MRRIRRVRDGGGRMLMLESTLVLSVATAAGYAERASVLRALTGLTSHRRLYTPGPGVTTFNGVRIALLTGILLSIPVVAYLVCANLLPTSGPLDPMLLAVPLLCVLGAIAGWVIVLPVALHSEATNSIQYLPSIKEFVDRTLGTLVASAACVGTVGALMLRRAG
jgi:Sec-independent protein secretion pathway component TatC